MADGAAVELRELTVRYPDFTLGPLNLTVSAGERVALVGPNGAGKSTTLRAISGLVPGYAGRVAVEGRDVRDLGPRVRARIGVLPERLLGFGWTTVAEHLRLLASFYPTWDPAYAEELRARLDLPADTKLANLSKGMQVKLSLVAAESFRPPILLLDEPTSGIDPVMRGDILRLIGECAAAEEGRTVLFSSHILEDVEEVAERVILLRGGRVLDDLRRDELRAGAGADTLARTLYRRLTHA
jgi:ABC-2 type transport system ATP-binding protein